MAEVIWTDPALSDLDAIADYIALDNPDAAKNFIQSIFRHGGQLADYPKNGSKPQELKGWRYRQIVEPPAVFFIEKRVRAFSYCILCGANGCSDPLFLHPRNKFPSR